MRKRNISSQNPMDSMEVMEVMEDSDYVSLSNPYLVFLGVR